MLKSSIGIVFILFFISSCTDDWYTIRWQGMEPNYVVGSSLLIKKQQKYDYGDVVVIEGVMAYPIIYRIAALSDDDIAIENNIIVLNGHKSDITFVKNTIDLEWQPVSQFKEKWLNGTELAIWIEDNPQYTRTANMNTVTVSSNHVFVLGDYRTVSPDSREIGSIPIEKIKGKVVRNWNYNK